MAPPELSTSRIHSISVFLSLWISQQVFRLEEQVLTPSAHPSPWLAARNLNLEVFTLAHKWSEHSRGHGLALGKALRAGSLQISKSEQPGISKSNANMYIMCDPPPSAKQIVEAFDVSQEDGFADGLNRCFPAQALADRTAGLVGRELDGSKLRITSVDGRKGRGLMTTSAFRDGETAQRTIVSMTCFFFKFEQIFD